MKYQEESKTYFGDEHFTRSAIRFSETLPESANIELVLLKIHLLIEKVLTETICKNFKNSKYIKEGRFTFSQKITLTRAIGGLHNQA